MSVVFYLCHEQSATVLIQRIVSCSFYDKQRSAAECLWARKGGQVASAIVHIQRVWRDLPCRYSACPLVLAPKQSYNRRRGRCVFWGNYSSLSAVSVMTLDSYGFHLNWVSQPEGEQDRTFQEKHWDM